jgi:hypothetical protein
MKGRHAGGRQGGGQEGRQKGCQEDSHIYRTTEYNHTYTDIRTYRWIERKRKTGIKLESRQEG